MFEAIEKRRTCRNFDTSRPIPQEILETIAKAGVVAPTGCDAQSFDLYVVSKQDVLDRVAEAAANNLPEPFKAKGFSPERIFYHAPTVIFIVPSRAERADCVNYDLGIIADSICIAAELSGVSSAVIGLASMCPAQKLKEILNLPNGTTAIGVALGYATSDWTPQPKEIRSKIQWIE